MIREAARRTEQRPFAVLAAMSGFLFALGLYSAWARTSFPPFAPTPNPLGIVSRTTDAGYAKSRDVAVLGFGVAACLAGAGAAIELWMAVAAALRSAAGGRAERALAGASLGLLPLALVTPWLLADPRSLPELSASALFVSLLALAVAGLFAGSTGEEAVAFARDHPHAPLFVAGCGVVWGIVVHLWIGSFRPGGWRFVPLCAGPLAALAAWQGLARLAARRSAGYGAWLAPAAHALAPTLVLALYPFLYFDRHPLRLLAPVAGAWTAWRSRRVLRFVPDPGGPTRVLAPYVWKLLLPVLLALTTLQPLFRDHPQGRDMLFYAEEGQHLAWADRILHGQVPGKDFFMLYGPLMEYGHAAWLRLFGVTTAESRAYFHVLDLAGIVAAYAFCRSFFAGSVLPFVAALVLASLGISPRVAFGLVPIWAAFRAAELDEKRLFTIAGAAIAALALFSQEVAVAAGIAVVAFVALDPLARVEGVARALRRPVQGGLAILVPSLLWLGWRGALYGTLENLLTYPRYVTMGYANSPYPDLVLGHAPGSYLRAFFGLTTPAIWYVPPIVYLAAAAVAIGAGLARLDPRGSRRLAIAIFGLVLFRAALGRSGPGKIYYVLPPAALVLLSFLDEAWEGARRGRPVAVGIAAAVTAYLVVPSVVSRADFFVARMGRIFGPTERGLVLLDLPRARGGGIPPDKARPLRAAVRYIDETIGPSEPMLAIPNDAALYFLADRRNPTRFDLFSQIVTDAHRREVLADLERRPPALCVYDTGITRVDDISDARQFPGALAFLYDRYEMTRRIGPFVMLRPAAAPAAPARDAIALLLVNGEARAFEGVVPRWHTTLELETAAPEPSHPRETVEVRVWTDTDAFVKVAPAGSHVRIDLADGTSWAFGGKPKAIEIRGPGKVTSARLVPRAPGRP